MGKQAKKGTSMRLGELAKKILAAEIKERKRKFPKEKVSATAVIEEALYALASKHPERRKLIIEAMKSDPRFSHISDLPSPEGDHKA